MTVLERILELRNERGWTEYKLSEESGIAQTTISSWYRKDVLPTIPSLKKICDAYNISLAQFFNYEGEPVALNEDQQILLNNWNRLNEKQKKAILDLIQTF